MKKDEFLVDLQAKKIWEKEQKKKKKVKHDYVCEQCGKVATRNIQNWWHAYEIDNEGDMHEVDDWEADENHFLCDDCDI